jgi:hypothetical protein
MTYFWPSLSRPFPGDVVTTPSTSSAAASILNAWSKANGHPAPFSMLLSTRPLIDPDHVQPDEPFWSMVEPVSEAFTGCPSVRIQIEDGIAHGMPLSDIEELARRYWQSSDPREDRDVWVAKAKVVVAFAHRSSEIIAAPLQQGHTDKSSHLVELPIIDADLEDLWEHLHFPEIVGARGHRFLALLTQRTDYDTRIFAVIPISNSREQNLVGRKLSLRQAFLHAEGAVFITHDFHDYSPWSRREFGNMHVPRKRYRFGGPNRKQSEFVGKWIERKVKSWTF